MEENNKKPDHIGNSLVFILLGLLLYAGYLSYRSIEWNVLKDLEAEQLILPTPISVATDSAQITPTSTATSPATKN